MNSVSLIGRLTRDPDVRYTAASQTAVARFSIAIDRYSNGEKSTDYPSIVVFGKQAENCEKYLTKGRLVGIEGRIQTGSYEKDGKKVYTTDVVAYRVEFLGGDKSGAGQRSNDEFFSQDVPSSEEQVPSKEEPLPSGLEMMESDEIPF